MSIKRIIFFALAALAFTGCKTAPETGPAAPPPEITRQDLDVTQELTNFKLSFTGTVQSKAAAKLTAVDYELVVEGKVVKSGTDQLNVEVPADGTATFTLQQSSKYVSSAEELKQVSEKGGSLLAALRGKLHVQSGGKEQVVEFARSKEIRTPRLPKISMHEAEGARYSDEEVNIIFYLGVENPNPFPLTLNGIQCTAAVAGKQLFEGKLGGGDRVSPSSTGVFEIPSLSFTRETYGDDVKKIVKTNSLPYQVKGTLSGDLFEIPFDMTGDLKLNVSK